MSAFDDGLRRLHEISDEIEGARVYDLRRREYGTLKAATPQGFMVRFPIEGRDLPYPADAFSSGVMRFDYPTEMRIRETVIALGRSAREAAKSGPRVRPPVGPVTPVAPPPPPPVPEPAAAAAPAAAAPLTPPEAFARDVKTILDTDFEILIATAQDKEAAFRAFSDRVKGALVGVAVTPYATPKNVAKGNVGPRGGLRPGLISAVAWRPRPTREDTETAQAYAAKLARQEEAGEIFVWSLTIRTEGVSGFTKVTSLTLFDEFALSLSATPAANVAAVRALAQEIRDTAADRQRLQALTAQSSRTRGSDTSRLGRFPAQAAPTPVFASSLEAEIMGMMQARPVAITFAVSGLGYILNMARFTDLGKGVNAVIRELRDALPKFRDAYEDDFAAWEEGGRQGKAPKFPWSVIILEMSNGSRVQIDPRTGTAYDPARPSEEVTRRLEVVLTTPKVGPTHPDTRAANEMRENLQRVGATEYGPGGRQYGSEALLREVRDAEFGGTGPLLRAADPGIEGQTRRGADLYRYRGKSRFQRMVEATPITETAETRLARAKQLGAYDPAALRDVEEALAIASGERITATSAETAFRRRIKLKEGENPDGRYINIAPGEYMIIGTARIFSKARAEAFLQNLGLTPRLITFADLGVAGAAAGAAAAAASAPRSTRRPPVGVPVPLPPSAPEEEEEEEEDEDEDESEEEDTSPVSLVQRAKTITRQIVDLNPNVLFLVAGRATSEGVEPLAKELAGRPNVVPIPLKGGKRAFTDADAEKSWPLISTAFAYPATALRAEETFPSSMRSTIVVIPEDVFGKQGEELKKSAPKTFAYVEQQLEGLETGEPVYPRAARYEASEGDYYVLVKSEDVQRGPDGSEYYILGGVGGFGGGARADQIVFPEDFESTRDWAAMLDYFVNASTAP